MHSYTYFVQLRKDYQYFIIVVNKNLVNKGNAEQKYFGTNLVEKYSYINDIADATV